MQDPEFITTEKLADLFCVKSTSIHHALCEKGHYLGLRPNKLPNGRLSWSTAPIKKLLSESA